MSEHVATVLGLFILGGFGILRPFATGQGKGDGRALASAERRIAMARALIAESKAALAAIRTSQGQRGGEA